MTVKMVHLLLPPFLIYTPTDLPLLTRKKRIIIGNEN
jgi:hypothetical protein